MRVAIARTGIFVQTEIEMKGNTMVISDFREVRALQYLSRSDSHTKFPPFLPPNLPYS